MLLHVVPGAYDVVIADIGGQAPDILLHRLQKKKTIVQAHTHSNIYSHIQTQNKPQTINTKTHQT